ncbi:hypothetical protein B0T26DRAFT_707348 [Lasiosphaeria miniovina]|uniref:Rhodopsin domain-containing protein n=1 Tax=Lasiosphaeria miniovina TaxID=1954250 RepID=A0AA40AJ77_9PEZI|nr:uncharacterized protein B0T26DRAFT_707348 [Lasiosphaeria miniovina]KAK0716822.1 hypothetical protein B0T26DRAFT_707348 [Lasiosphaeria miniovina]
MANEGADPKLGEGPRAMAILVPLFALALAVYALRIWTRARPKYRLNASDYTVSIAVLAETIVLVLTAVAVARGYGLPKKLLSPDNAETVGRTTFAVYMIALWAAAFARISVSCLLLNIAQERAWRIVLWGFIVIQALTLAAFDIIELVQCSPIRAMWAVVPNARCLNPDKVWIVVCFFAGIGTAGDVVCAVLPMLIIWRMSRSVVEKILVSILLGLGLLAGIGGVQKLVILKSWDPFSPNANRDIMNAFIWIRVEEITLIIGACAPPLKSFIERLLHRRFGFPQFDPAERGLDEVYTMPDSSSKPQRLLWDGSFQGSTSAASSAR